MSVSCSEVPVVKRGYLSVVDSCPLMEVPLYFSSDLCLLIFHMNEGQVFTRCFLHKGFASGKQCWLPQSLSFRISTIFILNFNSKEDHQQHPSVLLMGRGLHLVLKWIIFFLSLCVIVKLWPPTFGSLGPLLSNSWRRPQLTNYSYAPLTTRYGQPRFNLPRFHIN